MKKQIYQASGQVIDCKTKRGIPGLRVEAWDKDKKYNDLLGVAITDRSGRFRIFFDQTYFREYAPDTSPDLFFKVYRGQKIIKSTEDSVLWNAKTATEVTISFESPPSPPAGKDRITARQVFKVADFVQRSDFRGLWKETSDRTGTAFGFFTSMVKNTITKMDIEPFKVGTHKTSDVINQNVAVASRNLKAQKITVNEVKPYNPRLDTTSITNLIDFPVRLKPGQKVNLYEENGKVRYYSLVKDSAQESSVKAQQAAVDELKKELEITRQQFAQKDQQIATLVKEIEKLKKFRNNVEKSLKTDRIPPSK
ncbi:MAG: hypothetical protein ACMUIA_08135 [bacterium]